MRDLDEIEINEGGDPVARQPPTDDQVRDFQSHFQVELPEEYLILLCHSNGGHPKLDSFRPKGLTEEHSWGLNRFYHLSDDKTDIDSLWRTTAAWRMAVGQNVVPVANDSGGNQIMLDYRSCPPSVTICIHDDGYRMVDVADSFGEFIEMLCEDPEMI